MNNAITAETIGGTQHFLLISKVETASTRSVALLSTSTPVQAG
ncbi:hypothetical protein HMPREF1979_01660 [Actinomyces johnsonii F0542]|uniref:Uncharacterized protein n=1 Tax=Actinomyces johnsonii F0542 TaxID=1321818 RepID=U1RZF2_9ACTO|nr:hypothetical protein HMPREF1979_01660 [Actinomyces johnsonii F0542]